MFLFSHRSQQQQQSQKKISDQAFQGVGVKPGITVWRVEVNNKIQYNSKGKQFICELTNSL